MPRRVWAHAPHQTPGLRLRHQTIKCLHLLITLKSPRGRQSRMTGANRMNETVTTQNEALPAQAPRPEASQTRWQKFRLVVKVVELRLRFILIMAVTGLVFAYWETIWNRVDKWLRPQAEIEALAAPGFEFFCPMHPKVLRCEPGRCPFFGLPLS